MPGVAEFLAKDQHLLVDLAGLHDDQRALVGLDRAAAARRLPRLGATSFRTSAANSAAAALSSPVRSATV